MIFFFQLAIRSQESSEEPLVGSLGSPDGAPEARFGGHGKHHKVLTTGEHPIEDQHDYSNAKPNPGMCCEEKQNNCYSIAFLF